MSTVAVLLHTNYDFADDTGCAHLRGLFRSELVAADHVDDVLDGDADCAYCREGQTTHELGACCLIRHLAVMAR